MNQAARPIAVAAWLVVAAGASGCGPRAKTDAGAALTGVPPAAQTALAPDGDMLVPVRYIVEAQRSGVEILFVDARPQLDYDQGHIPGAVSVPYFEVDAHLAELPRDRLIVTYCECPHAEAVQVGDALVAAGFQWVKAIDEGLLGWEDAGGEVVRSDAGGDP